MSIEMHFVRHMAWLALMAVVMSLAPAKAIAVDPSYSGSWYRPAESGSGFNLEIFSPDRALLFWYTYDDDGQPVWLYSEGTIDGERIDFDVYYADGMRFSDLDSADKFNREWGTLTMQFSDCNNATIDYLSTLEGTPHSPVGTRTLPVQRLVNIASLPCRRHAAGYWSGTRVVPGLGIHGESVAVDYSGVLTEDGRFFLTSSGTAGLHIGTYVAEAGALTLDYQVCIDFSDRCGSARVGGYVDKEAVSAMFTDDDLYGEYFDMEYRSLYDRTVSLASIAGSYTFSDGGVGHSLVVAPDGAVQISATTGCTFAGQLVQPDAAFNLFTYSGTSSCSEATTMGVVVNTDIVRPDRKVLEFRLLSGSAAVVFSASRP